MFEQARSEAARRHRTSSPIGSIEGSVRVERRVPMLPFSREVTRFLAWLKRSLTVYRLLSVSPGRMTCWTTSRP